MYKLWKGGRRGFLRPWVLTMVGRSPRNGAEIMDEIEKMSWGFWRPSPGSVYPLLEELVKTEALEKGEDGKYHLTEKGRNEVWWQHGAPPSSPQSIDGMIREIEGYASYFEDLAVSDKARLEPHFLKMKSVGDRLSKISA